MIISGGKNILAGLVAVILVVGMGLVVWLWFRYHLPTNPQPEILGMTDQAEELETNQDTRQNQAELSESLPEPPIVSRREQTNSDLVTSAGVVEAVRPASNNQLPPTDISLSSIQTTQKILVSSELGDFFQFNYVLNTLETLPGFDEPAFQVLLSNEPVLQVWASEIINGQQLEFALPLESSANQHSEITFVVQNTGDQSYGTLATISNFKYLEKSYFTDVKTQPAKIEIKAIDEGDDEYYLRFLSPAAFRHRPLAYNFVWLDTLDSNGSVANVWCGSPLWVKTSPRPSGDPENYVCKNLLSNHPYKLEISAQDQTGKIVAVGDLEIFGESGTLSENPPGHALELTENQLHITYPEIQAQLIAYQVVYQHIVSGQVIDEAIRGVAQNTGQLVVYLGTCSEVCLPHEAISNTTVTLQFINLGQLTKTVSLHLADSS